MFLVEQENVAIQKDPKDSLPKNLLFDESLWLCNSEISEDSSLDEFFSIDKETMLKSPGSVISIKVNKRFSFVSNIPNSLSMPLLLIDLDQDKCLRKLCLNKQLTKSTLLSHPHYNLYSTLEDGIFLLKKKIRLQHEYKYGEIPQHFSTPLKEELRPEHLLH